MQNTNLISAEVVADSLNQYGERLTTLKLVFPRYILAELNTHRLFSKNSASSRAIPFKKMVAQVMETPFIPIAWQKNHPGMQGTEYLSKTDTFNLMGFMIALGDTILKVGEDSKDYAKLKKEYDEKLEIINSILRPYSKLRMTLDEWWLFARDKAVETASILYVFGVTKQMCNRILEPFLYHTVLLTASHFENFFNLRCPQYDMGYLGTHKSWKDVVKNERKAYKSGVSFGYDESNSLITRLFYNKGQADIHIMDLAEKMWDAMNDNKPKQLEIGQWHIPYGDNIDEVILFDTLRDLPILDGEIGNPISDTDIEKAKLKIATARCARISYQTLGDNPVIDYEKDIKLFDDLLTSGHWSPFEHCAQVMDGDDYFSHVKGLMKLDDMSIDDEYAYVSNRVTNPNVFGWSRNFKGFKQYRELLDDKY